MIFREWQEFVTYPLEPGRVRTRAERLDTSRAFRVGPDGGYPPDYATASDRGAVVDLGVIVQGGDTFESMEISDHGEVLIWTQQKVWLLLRKAPTTMEKLIYVPRHPPLPSSPPAPAV